MIGISAFLLCGVSVPGKARADAPGEAFRRRSSEIRAANDRFNGQANEVEKKYGEALTQHIQTGAPYPNMNADYSRLEDSRRSEVKSIEKSYVKSDSESRHQRVMEVANQLAGKPLPDRLMGTRGGKLKKLMQKALKGESTVPGGGGGPGGLGGPGSTLGGGGGLPDTGPKKPEIVLDGSGLAKEIEFRKKHPKPTGRVLTPEQQKAMDELNAPATSNGGGH